MKIIDADVLKSNMFDYAPPEMLWDRGDIEHKIDEMPEVKAISINWLNQKYKENDPDGGNEDYDYHMWECSDYIMAVWKEEQKGVE